MSQFFLVNGGGKQTSSFLSDLTRGYKRVIKLDKFNDLWRIGRSAIDAVAGSAGVPLALIRQDMRTVGVDPERFNTNMEMQMNAGEDQSAEGLEGVLQQAELSAKTVIPAGMVALGVGAILWLVLSRKGRSYTGGARKKFRVYRKRRSFRRRYPRYR